MSENTPIVLQLQKDAIDINISVASLLRVAKVIATKLDQKDALTWIDRELNGYEFLTFDDLPRYRLLMGEPKAFNRFRGWETIQFANPENFEAFSKAPLGQALGSVEESIRNKNNNGAAFTLPYPPALKTELYKWSNYPPDDIQLFISYGQLYAILEAVRNLILNWTLELEKAGILGENMSFTRKEKEEAGIVTQQFIAQNINVGVIGDVKDHAQVTNQQNATSDLDITKIQDFISQAKGALSLLPNETVKKLQPLLESASTEIAEKSPNQSKIKNLLQSVRTTCEGAAGNLVAQGITGLIVKLLGA